MIVVDLCYLFQHVLFALAGLIAAGVIGFLMFNIILKLFSRSKDMDDVDPDCTDAPGGDGGSDSDPGEE